MRPTHIVLMLTLALLGTGWASAQNVGSTQVEAKSKKTTKPKQKPKKAAEAPTAPTSVPAAAGSGNDLAPELQAVADQVHTGKLPCELGQSVTLLHDAHERGRFNLFIKNHVYHLTPVSSATGAIRLEDPAKGAVWIQLADKSMLMNSQLGQRMADVCQSPSQMQVAAAHKLAPPPSLLDSVPGTGLAQR